MAKFMASVAVLSKDAERKLKGGYAVIAGTTNKDVCHGNNSGCTNETDCSDTKNSGGCDNQTTCFH